VSPTPGGAVALHGGGEFLPGDEAFLLALLRAARPASETAPLRAVVVPTAAARQRPALAARHGVDALGRVAGEAGIPIAVEPALVVDAASAADPANLDRLAAADLVHLPGGEPDLVPRILEGTAAWQAILAAHAGGAVVAGASAGAMGLAAVTWTPDGFREGLALVGRLVVVPHFESFDARGREADIEQAGRERLPALGLDERTGVIREAGGAWRVAGEARAVWLPAGGEPVVGRHGDLLPIDA
jgi:cyanophycinase-like exopeptidase